MTKLQVVCDGNGRPLLINLTEGQASDHKAAAAMIGALPPAQSLLADRAYSAIGFRDALVQRGITPAFLRTPSTRSSTATIPSFIASAIKSRTSSPASKTGAASTRDTTAAPTPSYRQSLSPLPTSSGSNNESCP